MATYRIYKCSRCQKTSKTERVYEGLNFGNPLYTCKHCGALNYDKNIVEPALLSPKALTKDGRQRYNTLLLLLYMPVGAFAFFALSLLLKSFALGLIIVAVPLVLLTTLIIKKKKQVDVKDYSEVIEESIRRLESNEQYAQLVIQCQGNDIASAWSEKYR